ncbi:MAG: PEP-CTERM sorting domain-containing protein [Chthoniobacteraceae bacterium]|nr:PEP-CTERM sorting domain-containing protein [Chthoniobacteraceae bacterium]
MKRALSLASLFALLLQIPALASYSTTFDEYPLDGGSLSWGTSSAPGQFTLDGETIWTGLPNGKYTNGSTEVAVPLTSPANWVTTDANQLDKVTRVSGLGTPLTNQWAEIGGAVSTEYATAPSSTRVELWTPLSEKDISLHVVFAITSSSSLQNTYGWTFRSTTGDFLFAITFKEDPTESSLLDIYSVDDNGNEVFTHRAIYKNAKYDLTVNTDLSGGAYAASIEGNTGGPLSFDGSIASGADNIGEVGATWILESGDPDVYGDDMMLVDTYEVESIPEPSTIALAAGGIGILLAYRRKRRALNCE